MTRQSALVERFNRVVANLLRPTGVIPDSVTKVTDDIASVAKSVYSNCLAVNNARIWGNWWDTLENLSGALNYYDKGTQLDCLEYGRSLDWKALADSRQERVSPGTIHHPVHREAKVDSYPIVVSEIIYDTDTFEMMDWIVDYFLQAIFQLLCAGKVPEHLSNGSYYPLDVPDWEFHLRFCEGALRAFEEGLLPYGWIWESETTGHFLAFANKG